MSSHSSISKADLKQNKRTSNASNYQTDLKLPLINEQNSSGESPNPRERLHPPAHPIESELKSNRSFVSVGGGVSSTSKKRRLTSSSIQNYGHTKSFKGKREEGKEEEAEIKGARPKYSSTFVLPTIDKSSSDIKARTDIKPAEIED